MSSEVAIDGLKPPKILIPDPFAMLSEPKPIKIWFGGRNSAKTESAGRQIMLNMEAAEEPYRVVGARMFYNSIADSMYGMLKEFNKQYQFGFDDRANKITNLRNGSEVNFMGLSRNIANIKSKFQPKLLMIDEGDGLTQDIIDFYEPTFREEDSEIWVMFNPRDQSDAVWQHYIAPVWHHIERDGFFEDEDIYIRRVNYDENPFISDMAMRRLNKMRVNNPKKFKREYEGVPDGTYDNAIIEPEWVDAAIDAHIKLKFDGLGERVGSLDIADEGSDSKAYVERKGVVVDKLIEWDDGDFNECVGRGLKYATENKADNFIYDHDGMGRDVNVYLQVRNVKHRFDIEGFAGSGSVDHPDAFYDDADALDDDKKRLNKDVFRNKRAQYYFGLADRFYKTWLAVEKGHYIDPLKMISLSSSLPKLQDLRSELIKIPEKKTGSSRLKQIMSKSEMKSSLGYKSPNLADALMMSFAIDVKINKKKYVPRPLGGSSWRT